VVEKRYSSTLSLTSALDGALLPGKTRDPLYRSLCAPQGRSGRVRQISPPPRPGFDPRTVQSVASSYTELSRPIMWQRSKLIKCVSPTDLTGDRWKQWKEWQTAEGAGTGVTNERNAKWLCRWISKCFTTREPEHYASQTAVLFVKRGVHRGEVVIEIDCDIFQDTNRA